jgi:hypothetical protein
MRKFLCLAFIVTFFVGAMPRGLDAQVSSKVKNETSIVASVDVFNAKIISQNENKFQISFDIFNEQGIQPDVRYAVILVKKTSQGDIVVDNNTYEEVLNIGAGQTIKKEVEYNAPTFLKGDFTASVYVFTSDSLPLGIGFLGPIKLIGVDQYVEVVNESCYLTVDGEIPEKKYSLDQGVDVEKEEKLIGKCQIKNNFQSQITAIAKFENHYRTSSGKLVENENVPEQKFILNPGETKDVVVVIPKALQPQAYDAILEFMDLNKTIVSNKAAFHYVLRGESATIQNIKLDKDYYTSGDVAKVSFDWVGSADLHTQTRKNSDNRTANPSIRLVLNGSDGSACAQAIDAEAPKTEIERLRLAAYDMDIIKDCLNPRIVVQILNGGGRILAEKKVEIKSENSPISETIKPEASNYESLGGGSKIVFLILFIIGVVLFAVLIWISIGFFRKNKKLLGLLFVIGLSLFIGSEKAQALTFRNTYCDSPTHCLTADVVVGIDKSVYSVGESLRMDASIFDSYCTDGSHFNASVSSRNVPLEKKYLLIINNGGWGVSGSRYSNAPNVGGNYAVRFKAKTSWTNDTTNITDSDTNYAEIPYTVMGNGACNPLTNGITTTIKPTTNLCSTPYGNSTVSLSGTSWVWSCYGANGYNSASCSAPVAPPTVDLKINGSNGPLSLTKGDTKNTTWAVSNATSCTASSNDGFFGNKSVPSGSESLPANTTSNHTLSCTGPGGTGSDSVQVNVSCNESTGAWGQCDCATETKKRTNINTACQFWTETTDCAPQEKNSCRDFNWKEVAP